MARIIAIANQKGGVGKTTTAVNLAASLAVAERRTLLLDADPQGNATSGVGVNKAEVELSLYDVIMGASSARDAITRNPLLPHLDVLPATQDLVGAELELVDREGRETALRRALAPLDATYDYIIVDCPPSLGLLTLNVLTASDGVIIPIQCEYYALEGISQLLNTIRLVQQNFNPRLAIDGVLLTMYDARLNLSRQVAEDAKEYFGAQMFRTAVPRNVRLAEAPSFGKPILLYDVQSVGAKGYLAIAQELMRRAEGATGVSGELPQPIAGAAQPSRTEAEPHRFREVNRTEISNDTAVVSRAGELDRTAEIHRTTEVNRTAQMHDVAESHRAAQPVHADDAPISETPLNDAPAAEPVR